MDRRTLVVGVAILAGSIGAAGVAGTDSGTVTPVTLTCLAIMDAARQDDALEGDGNMTGCIEEGETMTRAEQIALLEAVLGD